jgi:ABC-2 type transport system permease protein
LLAGMAGMFLLFLANNGMSDLHREMRQGTLERFHTLHQQLLPFVAGKIVFTLVLLLFSSVVMLGGGAVIFRIHWQQPLALAALTLGYAAFAAGTMALLVALMPDERRGTALSTIAAMALGIMGGCAFPPQNLPAFLREHVSPLLPSYWFTDTVRRLNFGEANVPWLLASLKLAAVSGVLILLTAFVLRRRFKMGSRA